MSDVNPVKQAKTGLKGRNEADVSEMLRRVRSLVTDDSELMAHLAREVLGLSAENVRLSAELDRLSADPPKAEPDDEPA